MLQKAASRIFEKVDVLHGPADWLQVTPWGAPNDDPDRGCISISILREVIRDEQKLELTYRDEKDIETHRVVRPIGLSYRATCIWLAGWCELRGALRHFRTDRIYACNKLDEQFINQGDVLRELWLSAYLNDENNKKVT